MVSAQPWGCNGKVNRSAQGRVAEGLALIFDMDGVLLDSNPAHRQCWEIFNRRYGIETTEEMHQRMYGKRNDEIVRDFFGAGLSDEEVAARGAAKEALYRQMIAGRVEELLVPGIRSFLETQRGTPMAVASNAEPANVSFFLDQARLREYFQVVVDGHQVRRPKPDPEIYLKAAELLGVTPGSCIVFEDSYLGVEAAQAAGMRVVGVSTTYGSLPNTQICIDNFLNGCLFSWLAVQEAS
jgi:beta-phosphoglucomutase